MNAVCEYIMRVDISICIFVSSAYTPHIFLAIEIIGVISGAKFRIKSVPIYAEIIRLID